MQCHSSCLCQIRVVGHVRLDNSICQNERKPNLGAYYGDLWAVLSGTITPVGFCQKLGVVMGCVRLDQRNCLLNKKNHLH